MNTRKWSPGALMVVPPLLMVGGAALYKRMGRDAPDRAGGLSHGVARAEWTIEPATPAQRWEGYSHQVAVALSPTFPPPLWWGRWEPHTISALDELRPEAGVFRAGYQLSSVSLASPERAGLRRVKSFDRQGRVAPGLVTGLKFENGRYILRRALSITSVREPSDIYAVAAVRMGLLPPWSGRLLVRRAGQKMALPNVSRARTIRNFSYTVERQPGIVSGRAYAQSYILYSIKARFDYERELADGEVPPLRHIKAELLREDGRPAPGWTGGGIGFSGFGREAKSQRLGFGWSLPPQPQLAGQKMRLRCVFCVDERWPIEINIPLQY